MCLTWMSFDDNIAQKVAQCIISLMSKIKYKCIKKIYLKLLILIIELLLNIKKYSDTSFLLIKCTCIFHLADICI